MKNMSRFRECKERYQQKGRQQMKQWFLKKKKKTPDRNRIKSRQVVQSGTEGLPLHSNWEKRNIDKGT